MGFDLVIQSPFAVATYPPGATFGPRVLRNFEFVWIMEGDAAYKVGDTETAAPENSFVLCRPTAPQKQTDFFQWDATRRTRHAYFHFDLTSGGSDDWPVLQNWPLLQKPQTDNGSDLLSTLFRHLLATGTTHASGSQTVLLARTLLGAFVTGQFEIGANSGSTNDQSPLNAAAPLPELVRETMVFITAQLDENPAIPLSLHDLARHACVTPAYLCRVFAQSTAHSPMETVRQARLDKAVVLLARTNFSVGEIAQLCGFASPFHFSRRFRDAFGVSPRQMRQQIASGAFVPASRFDRRIGAL